MTRIPGIYCGLATLLLSLAPLAQSLAADDGLAERIAACTREQDDAKRLACFDRAAPPPSAQTTDQEFGMHGSELARNRDDGQGAPGESTPERITASVAELDKRPRGELVFTLDNGQVWAQKNAGAYFPVKIGDGVTVLAGTLGSFRLIVGNRATAVTRVR